MIAASHKEGCKGTEISDCSLLPISVLACFLFYSLKVQCVRQKEKSKKLSCAARQGTFSSLVSSAHLCNFSSFEKEVHYKIISSWGFAVSFGRTGTKLSELCFLESACQLCTGSSSFLRHFSRFFFSRKPVVPVDDLCERNVAVVFSQVTRGSAQVFNSQMRIRNLS